MAKKLVALVGRLGGPVGAAVDLLAIDEVVILAADHVLFQNTAKLNAQHFEGAGIATHVIGYPWFGTSPAVAVLSEVRAIFTKTLEDADAVLVAGDANMSALLSMAAAAQGVPVYGVDLSEEHVKKADITDLLSMRRSAQRQFVFPATATLLRLG